MQSVVLAICHFNPRSREGSDDRQALFDLSPPRFQSTLPRGERHHIFGHTSPAIDFNPRSREGSDLIRRQIFKLVHDTFQSTLPRGERRYRVGKQITVIGISIHAPARGATSILSKIHPMFLTISHNASSFSSFPFHSFLPHLLNSSTFCALFQVRISRAFSVYYRFAPKKSTPDL